MRLSETDRLEAFSDGVMAVIITIMAFSIPTPKGSTVADLRSLLPHLLVYVLSFVMVGIYWNNHHHLLRATERIGGSVMWANLFLLFWLSLFPIVTAWVGLYPRRPLPAMSYGLVGLGAGCAYSILVRMIIRVNGADSTVGRSVGADVKGYASLVLYAAGMMLAFVSPWIAYVFYAGVAVLWFIPDRRLVVNADDGS
ncbi:MAG TPA: TMEM175 family protein [Acidimicrobiales bacterium]